MGDTEARMQALFRLMEAGQISPDKKLRLWNGSDWEEIQLCQYEITTEREVFYSPRVAALINLGLETLQKNKGKESKD